MSEQNQKLSPNPGSGLLLDSVDPATGFAAYIIPATAQSPASPSEAMPFRAVISETGKGFGLPSQFWDWIRSDAELREEFEKMIAAETELRLQEKLTQVKDKAIAEGFEKGLSEGLAQANEKLNEAAQLLGATCRAIVHEQANLAKAQEITLSKALSHLLRRFLVPRSEAAVDGIRDWILQSISHFESQGKVVVRLSSEDLARLSDALPVLQKEQWEIKADASLKRGEIHVECGGGGIFFSTEEQLRKLETWIDRFVTKEGEWTG